MTTIAEKPRMAGYMKLLDRFPLKSIDTQAEHARAIEVLQDLIGAKLDKGEGDYLSALIVLVSRYEEENHAIDENMTPRQAVKALMDANGLSQAEMGKVIGSESVVSMFLKGKRQLSKNHVKKLVERFKVDASLFL